MAPNLTPPWSLVGGGDEATPGVENVLYPIFTERKTNYFLWPKKLKNITASNVTPPWSSRGEVTRTPLELKYEKTFLFLDFHRTKKKLLVWPANSEKILWHPMWSVTACDPLLHPSVVLGVGGHQATLWVEDVFYPIFTERKMNDFLWPKKLKNITAPNVTPPWSSRRGTLRGHPWSRKCFVSNFYRTKDEWLIVT